MAFTDHTRDLSFSGTVYLSSSGYSPSAVETSNALNVDTLEVISILDNKNITERDLMIGAWDGAEIDIFWVNYEDLSMGTLHQKTGTLGQVTLKGTQFIAEIRGLTQAYTNQIGELSAPMCRAALGDSRCKVPVINFTVAGVVEGIDVTNRVIDDARRVESGPTGGKPITGVSRARRAVITCASHGLGSGSVVYIEEVLGVVRSGAIDNAGNFHPGSGASINGYTYGVEIVDADHFSIPLDTRAGSDDPNSGVEWSLVYSDYAGGGMVNPQGDNGYFGYGVLTFQTGQNAGLSMEVKSSRTGTIELVLPMPYPINVGDAYTMVAGCGKRFVEDCHGRFNNTINFRGEPHLPGMDQLLAFGSHAEAE